MAIRPSSSSYLYLALFVIAGIAALIFALGVSTVRSAGWAVKERLRRESTEKLVLAEQQERAKAEKATSDLRSKTDRDLLRLNREKASAESIARDLETERDRLATEKRRLESQKNAIQTALDDQRRREQEAADNRLRQEQAQRLKEEQTRIAQREQEAAALKFKNEQAQNPIAPGPNRLQKYSIHNHTNWDIELIANWKNGPKQRTILPPGVAWNLGDSENDLELVGFLGSSRKAYLLRGAGDSSTNNFFFRMDRDGNIRLFSDENEPQ